MADDVRVRFPLRLDEFGGGAGRLLDSNGNPIADIYNGDMYLLSGIIDLMNRQFKDTED